MGRAEEALGQAKQSASHEDKNFSSDRDWSHNMLRFENTERERERTNTQGCKIAVGKWLGYGGEGDRLDHGSGWDGRGRAKRAGEGAEWSNGKARKAEG